MLLLLLLLLLEKASNHIHKTDSEERGRLQSSISKLKGFCCKTKTLGKNMGMDKFYKQVFWVMDLPIQQDSVLLVHGKCMIL